MRRRAAKRDNMGRLNFLSFEYRSRSHAAPWLFAAFVAGHLVVLYAAIAVLFPWTMQQQLSAGPWDIVLTFLMCSLVFCFGEYFFHRYLLHIEAVRILGRLCTSHLEHHKLTSIGFDEVQRNVRSAYAIKSVADDHSATFPPWALAAFFGFWTPFFAVAAFSFPTFPILLGGYAALATAHFLYETIHVAHHLPYDQWWKQRTERGVAAPLWRKLYGFHQAHHANYRCNLNVAGFFGLPLADLAFGTYRQPPTLLLDGAPATKALARELTPVPRWPIRWLDDLVLERRRRMSKEDEARRAASRTTAG